MIYKYNETISAKAIIVDLDRTLLHTDKTISDYTLQVFKKCHEKGILIMAATKFVSLGSMIGCVVNSIVICFLAPNNWLKIVPIIFLTIVVIIKHKDNIKRLIKGEESKLGKKSK